MATRMLLGPDERRPARLATRVSMARRTSSSRSGLESKVDVLMTSALRVATRSERRHERAMAVCDLLRDSSQSLGGHVVHDRLVARQGSFRRLGHAGRGRGYLHSWNNRKDEARRHRLGERDRTVAVPLGTVCPKDHIGCVPFGAEIVTRMLDPAR